MPDAAPFSYNSQPSAAIILAAGAATRMGSIKQLLPYRNGTLLSHAIVQAKQAGFSRVIVVLGAKSEAIATALEGSGIEIASNPNWESGMGSSLLAGLRQMEEGGQSPEILAILLADQPHVLSSHLTAMRDLLVSSGKPIVAAQYNDQFGVPALFRKSVFPLLHSVSPEVGARQLLRNTKNGVAGFPLPEAATDIDTPADFAGLEMVRP